MTSVDFVLLFICFFVFLLKYFVGSYEYNR